MLQAFLQLLRQQHAKRVMYSSPIYALISKKSFTANLIVDVQRMFFASLRSHLLCQHTYLAHCMQIVSLILW